MTGELEREGPFLGGRIEGLVNGDVFTFQGVIQGVATVDGAKMSGRVDGLLCPCIIVLYRVGEGRLSGDER